MRKAKDEIFYKFDGISKIMVKYMYYYYKKHKKIDSYGLLRFNEDNIHTFYRNVERQAIKISNKMQKGCYPDRHKIIAACLKSFVVAEIFCFDMDKYNELLKTVEQDDHFISLYSIYPNEMYCIEIIKVILNQYAPFKKLDHYHLKYADHIVGLENALPHNYVVDLFKLVLGYHKKSLDFVVQELAHIIFFIEMGYEISMKDLKHNYYNPEDH